MWSLHSLPFILCIALSWKLKLNPCCAQVRLEEVPDSCCDRSTKIQGSEKGSVSISCTYDSKHRNNLKYMCRGKQPSTCLQQAVITSDSKRNGRFRLTDDKVARKFTVTVTSLTQEDSGSYLCGVHRKHGLDVFSAVELEVKVVPQQTVTPPITVEPVTSQTTQSSEKPIEAPSRFFLFAASAILAAMLSLTFALMGMVYKYCRLRGAGVNVSTSTQRPSEAEEMVVVVDIYESQDGLGCYKQQGTLHPDVNAEEDQQEQMFTLTEVYSICN